MSIFGNEPSHELHPDPTRPGLRQSEIDDPGIPELQKSLRAWHDNKGHGWIANRVLDSGKTESAWISAVVLKSWRLALLVARLQIKVWSSHCVDSTPAAPRAATPEAVRPAALAATAEPSGRYQSRVPFTEAETSIPVLDDDWEERQLFVQKSKHFAQSLGYRRKRKKSELDSPTEAEENAGIEPTTIETMEHPGGKRARPDATMDWRSRVIQERRSRRKGRITGSSFDFIGDAIDEAQANQQIEEDLRILTKASLAELGAASDRFNTSSRNLGTRLPALTLGETSAAPSAVAASIGAEVVDDDEPSGQTPSSSSSVAPSSSNKMQRVTRPGRSASKVGLPSTYLEDDMACAGPQTEEDVDAAIKELLQVSQIY